METPIEYFTNEELIDELLKRDSFAGVLLASEDDARDIDFEDGGNFMLFVKGFAQKEAINLLEEVMDKLEEGSI